MQGEDSACAFVQRRPQEARLILHRFGEANPLIDERLLLLRRRIKGVDQRHHLARLGNTHRYPPLDYNGGRNRSRN
jgi:hypothetical protein